MTIQEVSLKGQSGSIDVFYVYAFWGDLRELDRLLQMYAVEKCRLEARKQGHQVTETALEDGSVKLQIVEGF